MARGAINRSSRVLTLAVGVASLIVSCLAPSSAWAFSWVDVLARLKELQESGVADDILYVVKSGNAYDIWRRPKSAGTGTTSWNQYTYVLPSHQPDSSLTGGCVGSNTLPVYTGAPDAGFTIEPLCSLGTWWGGGAAAGIDSGAHTYSAILAGTILTRIRAYGCAGQVRAEGEAAPSSTTGVSHTETIPGKRQCDSGGAAPTACKVQDRLEASFTNVTPGTCAVTVLFRLTVGASGGVDIYEVANGCIPDGYAVIGAVDGQHVVRRVIDDPSVAPGGACNAQGSTTYLNSGSNALPPTTGWPVASNPYPGVSGPPGTGPGGSGGPGVPGGSGQGPGVDGGGSGGCTGDCSPGGGGTNPGTPAPGGTGGISQAETQEAVRAGTKQALDEKEAEQKEECGGASGQDCQPSSGTYDTGLPEYVENSIYDLVTGFLAGNPIIAAITGTTLSASGSCDGPSFVAFGRSATLSMCPAEPALLSVGVILLSLSYIVAVFIAWRSF